MGRKKFTRDSRVFDRLFKRVHAEMAKHGREDSFDPPTTGDYLVWQEFQREGQLDISFENFELLRPPVIGALQDILKDFPGWEILMIVERLHATDKWPGMGLVIRAHEVIDDLLRDYLPTEYRDLHIPTARARRADEPMERGVM